MMEVKSCDVNNSSNGNLQNNSALEVSFSGGNAASAPRQRLGRATRALCPSSLSHYKVELKELLKIAWPITLSSLMMQLVMMVSIIFCGHLGKDELNAVAISTTIVNVMGCSIAMGLSTAFDTLFSQAYGSVNKKRVGTLLQRGILILLLACLPCWAVFINTGNILRLINLEPNVARLGQDFGTMFMLALPGYMLFMCLSKYLQCQSIVYPSMIIGGVANLLNAGFHALFLYVFEMEVRGASLAVGLSYWSMVVGHLLYIRVSRCYEKTWPGFQPYESLKEWGSFLHLAIPGMFMICLEWWGFEIMVVLAGILGPTPLAVHAVLYQFAAILFMLPLGLSTSASVRVGNHLGEGKPEEAKRSARTVMGMLWAGASVSIILLLSLRHILPYAYTDDHDVATLSTSIIPIVALFHLSDSTQGCASGILRGIGFQRFGAIVNIVAYYVIGIPLAVPLMLKTYLGIAGGWWAMIASNGFQSVSFLIRIALTDWLAESKRAIERALKGHPKTVEDNEDESPRTLPSAASSDDLIRRDQLAPQPDRRGSAVVLASAPQTKHDPYGTFGLEADRSLSQSSHTSLVVKRLVAVAVLVAIFLAGVFCNLFVTQKEPSCFVVNATELNATYISSEIHDMEWFSKLSLSDQQLVNETYEFEEDHFWNTTFLFCDGKIESVGNQTYPEYEGSVFEYNVPRIIHRPVG